MRNRRVDRTVVQTPGAAWTTHGIAVDPTANRLYTTNDNAAGTEGIRVYDATTFALLQSLAVTKPDYRSMAVDPDGGRLYIGHSTDAFEASGVRVLKAGDLSEIVNYPGTAYGNKVYGVSVDPATGAVYVFGTRPLPDRADRAAARKRLSPADDIPESVAAPFPRGRATGFWWEAPDRLGGGCGGRRRFGGLRETAAGLAQQARELCDLFFVETAEHLVFDRPDVFGHCLDLLDPGRGDREEDLPAVVGIAVAAHEPGVDEGGQSLGHRLRSHERAAGELRRGEPGKSLQHGERGVLPVVEARAP